MAFTFNSINSALDGNQKQDIFNPNAGAGAAAPQFGAPKQSDVFQTSGPSSPSAATAPSAGATAAPAARAAPNAARTTNPGQAAKAYQGIGNVNTSKETGSIGQNISTANQKLQDESNAYQAKADTTAAGYAVDKAQLSKAADGNDAAYQATAQRLAKTQADPVEAFGGLKDEDLAKGADVLKTGNYGEIFRPGASANYSTGESRLQSMLLGHDSGFKATANTLIGDQDRSIKASDQAKIDQTKTASDKLGKAYTDATGEARGTLEGLSNEVMSAAEKKAATEAAVRAGLDPKQLSQTEFKKIADQLKTELANDNTSALGRSKSYLDDPSNFDLSQYLTVNKDVNANQYLDKSGVERFNRINSLLGNGKTATLDDKGPGSQYTFDSTHATEALKAQLEGKRLADDNGLKDKLDAIQKSATGRASADQGDALTNARDYVSRMFLDRNEGQNEQQISAEQEAFTQMFNQGSKFNDYFTEQGGLTAPGSTPRAWQDLLTPQEAAQMNEYTAGLGTPGAFKAGSQYNTPNYNPQYFDSEFSKNFSRILAEIGPNTSSPMPVDESFDKGMEKGRGTGQVTTTGTGQASPRLPSPGINPATIYNPKTKAQLEAEAYANSKEGRMRADIKRYTGQ